MIEWEEGLIGDEGRGGGGEEGGRNSMVIDYDLLKSTQRSWKWFQGWIGGVLIMMMRES